MKVRIILFSLYSIRSKNSVSKNEVAILITDIKQLSINVLKQFNYIEEGKTENISENDVQPLKCLLKFYIKFLSVSWGICIL